MARVTKKPPYHKYISFPVVPFALPKQKAKATSKSPAITKIIQFIPLLFLFAKVGNENEVKFYK